MVGIWVVSLLFCNAYLCLALGILLDVGLKMEIFLIFFQDLGSYLLCCELICYDLGDFGLCYVM